MKVHELIAKLNQYDPDALVASGLHGEKPCTLHAVEELQDVNYLGSIPIVAILHNGD